jgi:hypothetical protein
MYLMFSACLMRRLGVGVLEVVKAYPGEFCGLQGREKMTVHEVVVVNGLSCIICENKPQVILAGCQPPFPEFRQERRPQVNLSF